MSEMKKEGPFAIIRDKDGRVVHRQIDQQGPRKNWRQYARLMTNDGLDMFQKMVSIAKGEAFQTEITLPTGEKMLSEPMIPPLSVQKEAAKDVFELIHGKAVAATEVVKAEEEAKELERVRAMSDDELYRLLERGTEEAVLVEAGDEVEQYAYDPSEATADEEWYQRGRNRDGDGDKE